VILAADKNDKPFWNTISRELEKDFSIIRAYDGKLYTSVNVAEMVLTDINSFRQFNTESTIMVFKNIDGADIDSITGNSQIAIVDSANDNLMHHVANMQIPAITCGLSARDTVTLSSISVDGAVVNLQRGMTGFYGDEIEPQEIPAIIEEEADHFALMSATVISLLCKKQPEEHNIASNNKKTHDHTSNANA